MKNISGKTKIIGLTSLTIFVLFSCMCASFAWFTVVSPGAKLDMVTGSMDVSIKKLSAYHYVYPYYNYSDSYIDYDQEGSVKAVVLKDDVSEIKQETTPVISPDDDINAGFYLLGNRTFAGDNTIADFSFSSGFRFHQDLNNSYTLTNITVSAGSIITIYEKGDSSGLILADNASYNSDEFKFSKSCLIAQVAGLYDFTITQDDDKNRKVEIKKSKRPDESILSMTLFDPTYAKFNNQEPDEAIFKQNTLIVYDVVLDVKNDGHDFLLDCSVKRSENNYSYPISNYLCFKTSSAVTDDENSTISTIYNTFHVQKENVYISDTDWKSFTSDSEQSLNLFDDKDNKVIRSASEKTERHYYIAADYNPQKMGTFFQESNLGKEFDLQRDYTLYFSTQQLIDGGGQQ